MITSYSQPVIYIDPLARVHGHIGALNKRELEQGQESSLVVGRRYRNVVDLIIRHSELVLRKVIKNFHLGRWVTVGVVLDVEVCNVDVF